MTPHSPTDRPRATVFAPGSIGNVGPGFDVLGLAVADIGDRVTVELTDGEARIESILGRDAELIPSDVRKNVASVAAAAWLRNAGIDKRAIVSIEKGLALAGGMGGSAASSVGGALAAALAAGYTNSDGTPDSKRVTAGSIMAAALEGESMVSGKHLDNIAPCVNGGLAIVRCVEPIDVAAVPAPEKWAVVLLTPRVRIETKAARAMLPREWPREAWVQQMANTASMVHAFATADGDLLRRSLDDLYAEPLRSRLIPHFYDVKRAALEAGALGCSISGSGPTIFAITDGLDHRCAESMKSAMGDVACDVHVGPIARQGAHRI